MSRFDISRKLSTRMTVITSFVIATIALVASFEGSHADDDGFVPGESTVYSTYNLTAPPFPGNVTAPILPTSNGQAGADDLLFQNLLSAEWIVFSFYQQGVEAFTASNFTEAGFKTTTYERIIEIRNNEAGHLRIFQEQISNVSVKPGACVYDFEFNKSVLTFLVLQVVLEISSMAFLTALSLQAQLNTTRGALVAIAEVETRHETWALIDVWNANPFSGPSDTVYPYVNQILDITNRFVVPGSCPTANPVYPKPRQNLPQLSSSNGGAPLLPGSPITLTYRNATNVPSFSDNRKYYAVFFHGLINISVPFDPKTSSSVVPKVFENKGIILVVIADQEGAPTEESVLAGPSIILLQPGIINVFIT